MLVAAAVASPLHAADTLFVAAIAEPGGDGQSWNAPYRYLADALSMAADGDEIWVARGAYEVDAFSATLPKGVRLYGGFGGYETLRELRDWYRRPSVVVLNGRWTLVEHDSTTRLDGLVFRGPIGGIDVQFGQPAFYNCRFTGFEGDALVLSQTGRVRVEFCQFDHNSGRGIAIRNHQDPPSYGYGPFIGETMFLANSTEATAGGIYVGASDVAPTVQIASCVFDSNYAALGGGAIAAETPVYIVNTTFVRNSVGTDAVAGGGTSLVVSGGLLQNSVMWNGDLPDTLKHVVQVKKDDAHTFTSTANLIEKDFDLGFWQSDPSFEDINDPMGPDGYFGTDDDGLRPSSFSVARDGGVVDKFVNHQNCDAIGNPRLVGRKVDLGAYESQRRGRLTPPEAMAELRTGTMVVFFRHAKTDWNSKDPGPSPDCFPGRNLIHEGREQSREIGKVMIAQGVPTGDGYSSPVCRCWETLDLMLGRYEKQQHWASGGGDAIAAARLQDLETIPTNGCRVISTHDAVANLVFNPAGDGEILTTAEIMEGDCLIIRPTGDTMEVLAQWCSDTWERYHVRFPDPATSVAEGPRVEGGLAAFPNPADDRVVLRTDVPMLVQITDLMGRDVWTGMVHGEVDVDTRHLAGGVYLVRSAQGPSVLLNVR